MLTALILVCSLATVSNDLPKNEAFKIICVRGAINRIEKAESGPGSRAR